MTTKLLITFACFCILTLTSIRERPIKPIVETSIINNELTAKELRLRSLENKSNTQKHEIKVTAIKLGIAK